MIRPFAWAMMRWRAVVCEPEQGSVVPLIVGFFLIAAMFCGAAVMASDAFTRQRDLQSICDGAASAAANSVDLSAVRTRLDQSRTLPLTDPQGAVESYLASDGGRAGVVAVAAITADATAVTVRCSQLSKLAFGGMFGRGAGTEQHASSTATAPLG